MGMGLVNQENGCKSTSRELRMREVDARLCVAQRPLIGVELCSNQPNIAMRCMAFNSAVGAFNVYIRSFPLQ